MERVNGLLRQEISRILASELKDPRMAAIVSVTQVDAAPDIRSARVFVSVLGTAEEKAGTLRALRSAAGFIRRTMRSNLDLRNLPAVDFRIDESIEKGNEILDLIGKVAPTSEQGSAT